MITEFIGISCSFRDIAVSYGIYDYNDEKIIKHKNFIRAISPFSNAYDDIKDKLKSINNSQEEEEYRRNVRKATRTRIVGGGFGISGAAKGMAVAGAINVGTGLAHGAVNMVGNMFTSISSSFDRSSLYNESLPYLCEGIKQSIYNLLPILAEVLRLNLPIDEQSEKNILNNISTGAFGNADLRAPYRQAFSAYPFDDNLYKAYVLTYPEDEANVVQMSEYFGIDLTEFLNEVKIVNGYCFKTLLCANYVRDIESNLTKEFDEVSNGAFSKKLFTEKFLLNNGDPYLVEYLLKNYSGDLLTYAGYEELNDFRRFMVQWLNGIKQKMRVTQLRGQEYGFALNQNFDTLTLKFSMWKAFFNDGTKLRRHVYCGYDLYYPENEEIKQIISKQNVPGSDIYFLYQCLDDYILVTSSMLETRSKYIPWAAVEDVSFEKTFIGSVLTLGGREFEKYSNIGYDMELVAHMLNTMKPYLDRTCMLQITLQKAVREQDPVYQNALGDAYRIENEDSFYLGQSFEKAKYWYNCALANGFTAAQQMLNMPEIANARNITESEALEQFEKVKEAIVGKEVPKETIETTTKEKAKEPENLTKKEFRKAIFYLIGTYFAGAFALEWLNWPLISFLFGLGICISIAIMIYSRIKALGKHGCIALLWFVPIVNLGLLLWLFFASSPEDDVSQNDTDNDN